MKKLITLFVLLGTIFTSCKKEETVKADAVASNQVEYQFKCVSCLVQFEDDIWNHTNELDRSKYQYINVYKGATYTFTNKVIEETKIKFYMGSIAFGVQDCELIVKKGGKVIAHEKFKLGYTYDKDYGYEKFFNISLK